MSCLRVLSRNLALAAVFIVLSGCTPVGQWIELDGGGLRIGMETSGCRFWFDELTPEGMSPNLSVHGGGHHHLSSLFFGLGAESRRSRLPRGYRLFVDEEWILATKIRFAKERDCFDYEMYGVEYSSCSYETVFHRGSLILTPEDFARLGTAISRAEDPVELKLQGFEPGAFDPLQDEWFVYSIPRMVGDFLLDPRTTCDRWRAEYAPQE